MLWEKQSIPKSKNHFNNKPLIVGIVFEPIKDTVVKTIYTKNELKLTSITNLWLWVGIVFEPIKDTVLKTIYTKKIIKN